jgi:GT2 family glycosyltransferase/glycosyltransferase involved in cell wall biosynthesis
MHRSGTSVATRLVNLLGVYLGPEEHLLSSRPDNPKGFWEYQPILELNVAILERLGGDWHEPPFFPPGWEIAPEFADLRQRARTLVARHFTTDQWGWKDPRTCLTLPFWKQVLPPVHYVICMRSPVEVAASLQKRDGFAIEKSIRLWQLYTGEAIEHTAGVPRHFIFFEDMIHSPREETTRLAQFLGRQDALEQPGILAAIADFIDPEFHRHQTSFLNTLDNPTVMFPAKALYFALHVAAKRGKAPHGLSDLSGQNWGDEQFWPIFSRSSRRAQAERDELTDSRSALELRISGLCNEADEFRRQLSELETAAATHEGSLSAVQERSNQLQAEIERLDKQRAQAEKTATELRAGFDERAITCQEQATAIATRDAEIAALADERAALVQRMEDERAALQTEIQSIQARLDAVTTDNQRLDDERAQAAASARELRAGLDERELAYQEQARVIAGREAEISTLADERAALLQRMEDERLARQADVASIQARLDDERARAEATACELHAGLDQRDAICQEQARVIASRDAEIAALANERAAVLERMEAEREARQAEIASIQAGLKAITTQSRRLEEQRAQAEATVHELRAGLEARDSVVALLESRLSDLLVTREAANERAREATETATHLEARIAGLAGQIGALAVEFAEMGSREGSREAAIRQIRDQISARQDDIEATLSHLSGKVDLDTNYQRIWKNNDRQFYALDRTDWSQGPEPGTRKTVAAYPALGSSDVLTAHSSPEPIEALVLPAVEATPVSEPDKLSKYGQYVRLVGELQELVPSLLPEGSTLMVISRGDEELVRMNGVRGWHFPQAQNGAYAGHHPADDQAAIGHLHALVRTGGQYLLIPSTAFWWLDYYKEFARHLEEHSECLVRDDRCVLYRFLQSLGAARGVAGIAPDEPLAPDRTEVAIQCPVIFQPPAPIDRYDAWLQVNEWSLRRASLLRRNLARVTTRPLLSIIMPVYDPPIAFLNRAIQSVREQVYELWELCIANDACTDPEVVRLLSDWEGRDPRIKVTRRQQNGNISRATNTAAEMAEGEFLVLMDHDDEIEPDALGEVVLALSEQPDADIFYTDDDKIDESGRRFAPQFKPDWSPELLLSYMYMSHLLVMRRTLYWKAGGMRLGFEGSQDYDMVLRATEIAGSIVHIPRILYHWRVLPGSTASSGLAKPDSFHAGLKAVQEALERRRSKGEAVHPEWAAKAGCGIFCHRFPDRGPRVAILIPTKNHGKILKTCVESLAQTTYENYEIVIIDNKSDDADTLAYFEKLPHRILRIPNPGERFSYAAINNLAVSQVNSELVLFLNDDTEVIEPTWLSQMVGYLGMPGVGAVGARLLYPDGRVQHAGVIHGLYHGKAGPAFKLSPCWDNGYLSYARVARNYSAVTAACMLTRRDHFLALGGFDEESFPVAYNDVDYSYRLIDAGRRVVYCAGAELYHHEGHSRGSVDNPEELASFLGKYRGRRDPYYNANLSLDDEQFSIDARTVAPTGLGPVPTLMLAFNLNWEGAPYSQFEMTARLKELGIIEPIVYCPHDGPLRQEYERMGIRVDIFPHPLSGVFTIAAYDESIRAFARYIREKGIELVYGNTLQTFYGIDAARAAGLPSIWNPRESEPWQTYFDHFVPEIAARALGCFRYPYKVVFVADATRQGFSALDTHHNFTTVHNGLNRERFAETLAQWPRETARRRLELDEDALAVLILGTVCDRKGQLDVIESLGHLAAESARRVTCFIVGDRPGAYSERLHAAHQSLGERLSSRIRIIAETPDVALYYSAADLFVCSSRIESFPRVILEAMAAGLPIITTPVFGIREQVQENINALFYPPGDSRALAEAMRRLLHDTGLRTRMARNSQLVLAALNDYQTMAATYGRIFLEAWMSGGPRPCVESSE